MNGKTCAVCFTWYPQSEFEYGGRVNNPYCGKCKAEYARIYEKEKSAGTKRWLAEMKAKREQDK